MSRLHHSTAEVIPLIEREEPISFDQFLDLSVDEVESAFAEVEDPQGDVAPFLTTVAGRSFGVIVWNSLDEELEDKFLTHVVPPVIAANDFEMVSLVLTTFMSPLTEEQIEFYGSDRFEALLVAALSKAAQECALHARISRSEGKPPQLGRFEVAADKLPPAVARPLYAGLFGDVG